MPVTIQCRECGTMVTEYADYAGVLLCLKCDRDLPEAEAVDARRDRPTLIERHLPALLDAAHKDLYRLAHKSYLTPGERKTLQALFTALAELEPNSPWLGHRRRLVTPWLDHKPAPGLASCPTVG
jgi:hypothetical protein